MIADKRRSIVATAPNYAPFTYHLPDTMASDDTVSFAPKLNGRSCRICEFALAK
jgi:hypothetical protein